MKVKGLKVAPELIAFDSSQQTAFSQAVKKIKKTIVSEAEEKELKYRRGIILINHLPHGFYENELQGFFKQFGNVTRLRVARSKKTGRSKGYAFVEFEFEEVAKIAAESMHNYLMFERLIKCQFLTEKVNARKIFAGTVGKDNYPTLVRRNKLKEVLDNPTIKPTKTLEMRLESIERRNKKLAELGIDYTFNIQLPTQSKAKKVTQPLKNLDTVAKKTPIKKQRLSSSVQIETKPEKPKFSPKLLRSKTRKSEAPLPLETSVTVANKNQIKKQRLSCNVQMMGNKPNTSDTTAKKNQLKKQRLSCNVQMEVNKPEKPKFSPKLLRSKTKEIALMSPSANSLKRRKSTV